MLELIGEEERGPSYKLVKLILVGEHSGVGKSCFLDRFCNDRFTTSNICTIGIDFKIQSVRHNNTTYKLQIWDTSGNYRFRTISEAYLRGIDGVIFFSAITKLRQQLLTA